MQTETQTDTRPLPPGSLGLPGIGETLHLFLDKSFIARRRQKYGAIFKTHLLGSPTICMVGPEAVSFVLKTHMDHFSWGGGWPDTFKQLLGDSLFVQDGEEHRRNRQLLLPAFHGKALAGYFAILSAILERYLATWEEQREFAWYDQYKQILFDMTSQVLLGASSEEDVARLSDLFTTLTKGMYTPPVLTNLWPNFRRARAARQEILKHVEAVVRQRQENPTNDALSLLIMSRDEDGNGMALKELIAQAMLLLFAGHETTTAMLTSITMELSRNPEVLARARAEQAQLAAQGPLSFEQIKAMPYLDQVLREAERLHAPGIGGFRGVVKPFEFNGYYVPAGWKVHYSIYGTHHDDATYPDAERFDPDRFSPERQEHKNKPFSLVGYGGGPRICIGFGLAQLEMKLILARLLRSYQWDVLPGQQLDTVLLPSVQPKDGVRVFLRRWYPEQAPAQAPAPEQMTSPADRALGFAQAFGPAAQRTAADDGQPARCPYSGALLG